MMRMGRGAVRESLDCLEMGLCYCTVAGRVLLANRRMRALAVRILSCGLSDALGFYELVCKGILPDGIVGEAYGDEPVLSFPEGDVWQFSCQTLFLGSRKIFLVSAVDVTVEHGIRMELEQSAVSLRKMQARLQQYSRDLEDVTVMEERLLTKGRIHAELGRVLLSGRLALAADAEVSDDLLDPWRRMVALLKGQDAAVPEDAVSVLLSAAGQLGVDLHIAGAFPVSELAADICAEALNNAVRHGRASRMDVSCGAVDGGICLVVSNDGLPVSGSVREGGGLAGLRHRVEQSGGWMEVVPDPFCVRVWFPFGGV